MEVTTGLVRGIDTLTLLDLLEMAATHKGLKFQDGASKAYSEPFKEYILDEKLLAMLAERGIKRQERPGCRNEIFTLVDENHQYWNFKLREGDKCEFDLRIKLFVGFGIKYEKRGVVLVPMTQSSYGGPVDQLPNFRMFKFLVENDNDAPSVAKELATSDGTIVVSWTELGLGGIRLLTVLFTEFANGNETVMQLGRNGQVFYPIPYLRYRQPGDELFVTESAQPKVFESWRAQLNEYRTRLTV